MTGNWCSPYMFGPQRGIEYLVELPDGRQVRAQWQPNALMAHWVGTDGTRYRRAGSHYLRPTTHQYCLAAGAGHD